MSTVTSGLTYPLGASLTADGVNFSVHSKSCSRMELLLFDGPDDAEPSRVIHLDPAKHHTFHYWHVHVGGLGPGQIYAYRAHGPFEPEKGLRFDGKKVLLDPYGRAIAVPRAFDRAACSGRGDSAPFAMKSVVADLNAYDWEGDCPLYRPFNKTVIYEMHVRGFTVHDSSGVPQTKRGTYAGVIEKIPYLQDLGITAVELMPVFQFDPQEAPPDLTNYWGYNPVSFFVPHAAYASDPAPLAVLDEFRDMVKALHRAGIEVILDVVYNHTAEGNENGPTYSFKGLENNGYYIMEHFTDDRGDSQTRYADYTGCGNTLNGNHAVVRRLILSSLRYWVEEMHVDGFRFDLASVLSRDIHGHPQANPPLLWDIETDPVLSGTKLIAEAWDAAGLYQVGNFFGDHWKEWNGRFRDDIRAFVKSDPGTVSNFASRFLGSPDIYGHRNREPEQSINFVTSHDGFTLNDLVSYEEKHNEANKEDNRDGHNENLSWNCGVEGPTDDPEIEQLRLKQIKNFLTINVLAFGVPMIQMGDEMRRTQRGNNNAYCQDNDVSWLDWRLLEKHSGLHRFVRSLLEYRRRLPERLDPKLTLTDVITLSRVIWHGPELNNPDWSDESRSIAFMIPTPMRRHYLIFNARWDAMRFALPKNPEEYFGPWQRVIDTSRTSPDDIGEGVTVDDAESYEVQSRSSVILIADRLARS